MDEQALASRLSRISTIWSLVDEARDVSESAAHRARVAMIQRYQGAVYRYLLGAVRDPDAADDLFQEFALRCIKGAFCRVQPGRGRFRDYLKTTLVHLISDHFRQQVRRPRPLESSVQPAAAPWDPADADRQFLCSWRDAILDHAWTALAEAERQGGQPYYSLLRFRAEHPEATSPEMAAQLTSQLGRAQPFTETGVRKTLQRARAEFAELLVAEVEGSLEQPTPDDLEQELLDLELMKYCRSAFVQRRTGDRP